jgi:AhpD family alkylhydroperoxidase
VATRMNDKRAFRSTYQQLGGIETYLHDSSIENTLLHLIKMRVSQINGCAYCLAMHARDLRDAGEREDRIYVLPAWRETSWFSERERAALAWAEALTTLPNQEVPEEVFAMASDEFTEPELADLTLAVIAINGWNRLNIAFHAEPTPFPVAETERQAAD